MHRDTLNHVAVTKWGVNQVCWQIYLFFWMDWLTDGDIQERLYYHNVCGWSLEVLEKDRNRDWIRQALPSPPIEYCWHQLIGRSRAAGDHFRRYGIKGVWRDQLWHDQYDQAGIQAKECMLDTSKGSGTGSRCSVGVEKDKKREGGTLIWRETARRARMRISMFMMDDQKATSHYIPFQIFIRNQSIWWR